MAEFDQRRMQAGAGAQAADIDEGLRAHMLRVYNYMSAALVITGLVAYFAAAPAFMSRWPQHRLFGW